MINILDSIISFDSYIEQLVLLLRTGSLDNFFFGMTILGHWLTIIFLFFLIAFILRQNKKSGSISAFFVSIAGAGLTTVLIKAVVDRARPSGEIALYTETLASFPSAHAALAFALFGLLAYFICTLDVSKLTKILSSLACSLIIVLVGLSRIYLGVHFASDVVAGYLVGLVWLLIAKRSLV